MLVLRVRPVSQQHGLVCLSAALCQTYTDRARKAGERENGREEKRGRGRVMEAARGCGGPVEGLCPTGDENRGPLAPFFLFYNF